MPYEIQASSFLFETKRHKPSHLPQYKMKTTINFPVILYLVFLFICENECLMNVSFSQGKQAKFMAILGWHKQ